MKITQFTRCIKIFFANLHFRVKDKKSYCDVHTDKVVNTFSSAFGNNYSLFYRIFFADLNFKLRDQKVNHAGHTDIYKAVFL